MKSRLIAQVLGETLGDDPNDVELDPQGIERAMAYMRERFLKKGHSPQEWLKYEPKFRAHFMDKGDKDVLHVVRGTARSRQEMDAERREAHFQQQHAMPFPTDRPPRQRIKPPGRYQRAMADEPSLRRGESLVADTIINIVYG